MCVKYVVVICILCALKDSALDFCLQQKLLLLGMIDVL